MKLKIGQKAPDFTLPDGEGKEHSLSDYAGQWVLLYFYPKDDTPGCTIEACTIRDHYASFQKMKMKVLGVSVDGAKSHEKFAKKYDLPFTLLSDADKSIVKLYGAYGEKTLFGKKITGTKRMSFLVNPDGRVAKIYPSVKPAEHAGQVLHDTRTL